MSQNADSNIPPHVLDMLAEYRGKMTMEDALKSVEDAYCIFIEDDDEQRSGEHEDRLRLDLKILQATALVDIAKSLRTLAERAVYPTEA